MTGAGGAGAMSGGTRASAAGVMLEPSFAWRGGRIVSERAGARLQSFGVRPGKPWPGISVGSTEHFALPRVAPGLREVDVYLGWFGPLSRGVQAFSLASSLLMRVPGARTGLDALVGRLVQGSTGGPDAGARARTTSVVVARALDAAGSRLAEVRLEGVNGYDFTAGMLAWGAVTAAAGGLQGTGALGPVDGFGLDALQAGAAEAGLQAD
jgi:hypothetical protein